jgi:hypothetical protein
MNSLYITEILTEQGKETVNFMRLAIKLGQMFANCYSVVKSAVSFKVSEISRPLVVESCFSVVILEKTCPLEGGILGTSIDPRPYNSLSSPLKLVPLEKGKGIQYRLLANSFVWVPTSVGTTVKAEGIYGCCCDSWLIIGYFHWGKTI